MLTERLWFILGTRPEIVKLSPLIEIACRLKCQFSVIHTGQHYDSNLDSVFFEELGLPAPAENLNVGSGSHAAQTARILVGVERLLMTQGPGTVIVEGDTNTTLGAALAAAHIQGATLAHVEAGCRSFNRAMPEEINRVVVDHLSDVLFAATRTDLRNLEREGLASRTILVGSTGVEACLTHVSRARERSMILNRLSLHPAGYALCTVHRQENTDSPNRLRGVFEGLRRVAEHLPVVFPVHPRTASCVKRFGLAWPENVTCIPPLGYLDFLAALASAKVVLTDSGGVQEEAAVLGTRCFTLRDETEWVFTLEAGVNELVGTDPSRIHESIVAFLQDGKPSMKVEPAWPIGRPPSEAIFSFLEKGVRR